ncbi:MAG: amidohydrolase family protein [Chloroflexi bacterium]|nr:amidohydrolase family protein [Chloroflexota bacterium]
MPQIVQARYTLLNGEAKADHAICIDGDRIIAAGKLADLLSRYPDVELAGGDSSILSPAFTNAHDHGRAIGTLALGVPDDFLEVWLPTLLSLPQIPPYLAALHSGLLLLRSGVTGVAHSHNPGSWAGMPAEIPEAIRGYRDAGLRVAMHPPIIDQNMLVYTERERFLASLPPELRGEFDAADRIDLSAESYFDMLDDLYAAFHDISKHRVHIQVSPAGGQWCSDALILRACDWARRRDSRVQMHLLETRYQRHYAHKTWGKSFVQHLADIGVLGEWLTLAHMVWVEEEDIDLLAERGVGVAHNISSNLRLRSGLAPVARMVEAGVAVGIGLDGQTLDDDQDFLREMRLAWTLANRSGMAASDLSASDVWRMSTQIAADITFGAEAGLGQLEVGAPADLVLLDWEGIRGKWAPPDFPPPELLPEFLLRRVKREHVRDVMVAGEWLVRDGAHVSVDIEEVERELYARLDFASDGAALDLAAYLREFYRGWDEDDK